MHEIELSPRAGLDEDLGTHAHSMDSLSSAGPRACDARTWCKPCGLDLCLVFRGREGGSERERERGKKKISRYQDKI